MKIHKFFLSLALLSLFASCSKAKTQVPEPVVVTPVTPVPPVTAVTDTVPPNYGIPFPDVPERQDATIYEVNIKVFSPTRNFQGVIARLDSIKALGINVVYLMPIYPVGIINSVNSPYCVRDYNSVNTDFGTLADLRALVDAAHSKGMSVILDWVANHTSWDNPWITAHRDWYLQDGAGNIVHPPNTNYTDVAQLNFSNQAMRVEMAKTMRNWVYKANIDGFRCDYADGPPVDFWAQVIDTLRHISTHHLLVMAEGNRSTNYNAGFDFGFGFSFYGQLKSIFNNNQSVLLIDTINTTEYANTSNGQQIVRYTSNHDINGSDGTPLELFGGAAGSMAAFVVAAYMKSVPMVYNGQEVGLPYRLTFPFTGQTINWTLNPDLTSEYKRILLFRQGSPAVRRGTLNSYSSPDVCVFTKQVSGERVLVIANLRNSVSVYALPAIIASSSWTDAMNGGTVALTTQITLQPYSYFILKQ